MSLTPTAKLCEVCRFNANMTVVLKAETETCMRLLGVERVDQLGMQHINTRAVERDIYDGPSFARAAVENAARGTVKAKL